MALHDTLNLRRDEVVPVSLLLFQSVFLGFFLGAFDVGANTLFLNSFEQSMIPKAFVISGVVGIILTSLYSHFQQRVSFSTLAAMNLGLVFIITFLLRTGYYFSDTKWLAFALFVLMGPLNILALVGFWGTVGRIFDLRQGKRIFGFIDTGQVIGVIISSLSVPFLITAGFITKDLLYISAVSIFLAVIIQFIISSKYPLKLKVKVVKEKSSTFIDTLRIPYVRTMAFFVVFSMLVAFFVHYLFLSVARERFESADEMAKFFGGLMGTLTIVSVLIKAFVYGPLMKTYGLKISLLISPAVMIIVVTSAALVGSVFGYTLESASFTFFFLLISLSKFFQKALKDSIEAPVLKLLYQSLSPNIRHEVQARVDGTINEMAALLSGVFLTLLGFIGFFSLINYTHVLLGIIFVWLFVSVKLFQGYRKTLKETLEKASQKDSKVERHIVWIEAVSHLPANDQLKLLESSKPWLIPAYLDTNIRYAKGEHLAMLCEEAMQKAEVYLLGILKERLTKDIDENDKLVATTTINLLNKLQEQAKNEDLIKELILSKNFEDRQLAAKLIGLSTKSSIKQDLTFLLRDLVPQVKKQALWAARGLKSKEIITFLIDFLNKDEYAPLAHAALMNTGEIGLEMLMMAFSRTGSTDELRKHIIRIIPDTGSVIANSVLFEKLSIQSSFKSEVLDGLLKLDFNADDRETVALHQMLVEQAGVCAWNLNVIHHCPPDSKAPNLKSELELEFNSSRHNLFQLLKLLYDKSSIDAVIENLEMGTGESISFAIELLDTFVIEDLKPYIFPLLEDTTLTNKIWALQNYYPLRVYSYEELLKAIINRNENLLGKQAKIYALNAFANMESVEITFDLAAQLFNTDIILRQLSAQLIQTANQERYLKIKRRLNDRLRVELDRSLDMAGQANRTAIQRLAFYRSLPYSKVHSAPLFWLYNSSTIQVSNIDLLSLGLFKGKDFVFLIETGTLTLVGVDKNEKTYNEGDIFIAKDISAPEHKLISGNGTILHFVEYKKFLKDIYHSDYLIEFLQ